MSHLDELDEYEAELELRLKKEYADVYRWYRYSITTQDFAYLCKRYELHQASQPAYPFFHIELEDAWIWDKNRPVRTIGRVEVFTTGDVTIEELRGEGEEPEISLDALLRRDERPRDDD